MRMRLRLKANCLDVFELSSGGDEKEDDFSEEEGVCSEVYELVMAVGHVKEAWMEVPGNLVAHIKVGPSYHLRKEVSCSHLNCRSLLESLNNELIITCNVSCDLHVMCRVWPELSGICSMIFTLPH